MPPKTSKGKTSPKKQNKGQGFDFKIVFALSALVCVGSYIAFKSWMKPPDLPTVDHNQFWGSDYSKMDKDDKYKTITEFEIKFSDVIVNDLRERLLHHRKPPLPLENAGFTYGFNSNFLTQVVDYWANKYNFEERERFLNQYKHWVTNIQGLDIHYMHVIPTVGDDVQVLPLLMLHGWPGSFREFYEMVPLLTKPREGRKFVFELIVPSLPGFGFSQGSARAGLGPLEMAVIMQNLMTRLGHIKYYVQGGDFGHMVGSIMATLYPNAVLGFHTNFPALMFNPQASMWITLGSLWPSLIEVPQLQSRLYPLTSRLADTIQESGYMHLHATKPDTVGAALSDSPAGLAAYILEKFSTWTNPDFRQASDGQLLEKYSLTHLLDNVMIYWASNSITTSMRVYAETFSSNSSSMLMDRIPTDVPTWGIKFKHELVYHPDCVLKLKYPNYLQSTVVDGGGHFAAMENPELLADDVFKAVDTFIKFHAGAIGEKSPETIHTTPKTVHNFTVNDIYGNPIKLEKYKGYTLLIVNVASQCGLTDTNYKELNQLHDKYYSKGLRILAFPCNQFNSQEPGSAKDILNFTKDRGVKFDLFEKIDVNGENADPLWQFLKKEMPGSMGDFIKWNFSKFIVDKNGIPVERLGPNVNPLDLEPYLVKYL